MVWSVCFNITWISKGNSSNRQWSDASGGLTFKAGLCVSNSKKYSFAAQRVYMNGSFEHRHWYAVISLPKCQRILNKKLRPSFIPTLPSSALPTPTQ